MDIPIDAKVRCTDGPCGQSSHVVLMPTNEKITHLVVDNGCSLKTNTWSPWNILRKVRRN